MTQQSGSGAGGTTTTGSPPTGERAAADAVAQDHAKQDVADDLSELRRDLASLAQNVATLTQKGIGPYTRQLESMVDRNPMAAIGIAAGVGLLFSIFFLRR